MANERLIFEIQVVAQDDHRKARRVEVEGSMEELEKAPQSILGRAFDAAALADPSSVWVFRALAIKGAQTKAYVVDATYGPWAGVEPWRDTVWATNACEAEFQARVQLNLNAGSAWFSKAEMRDYFAGFEDHEIHSVQLYEVSDEFKLTRALQLLNEFASLLSHHQLLPADPRKPRGEAPSEARRLIEEAALLMDGTSVSPNKAIQALAGKGGGALRAGRRARIAP